MNTRNTASNHPLHPFIMFGLLGACATNTPNPPIIVPQTATVTGIVEIDNTLQGATVYVDYNDNNQADSWEPQATTDATGHFTLTFENSGPLYPLRIGALVSPTSTRVGASGQSAAVGFALHMRAPLGDTPGDFTANVVISPLTTLVASEMGNDPTLTLSSAQTKITAALAASQLPFSGQPDVMVDYATDAKAQTATSPNSVQLRYIAGSVAAIVSGAAHEINSVQSTVDCNDATFFNPAIAAMDEQLTAIANGTFKFSQLSPAEQSAIAQNPGSYNDYFIDAGALATDIENELIAEASDIAAAIFEELESEFASQYEELVVETVADELITELII